MTGRKNQIRVHLAGIGHPIVGDKKYGKRDDSHARLALHARAISFKHPFSGKQLAFSAEPPGDFSSSSAASKPRARRTSFEDSQASPAG